MSGEPSAKTVPARSASGPVTKQARRRRSSGIGVPIARSRFLMIAVAVFVGLGLAWWAATGLEWVKPIFLPSPGSVATQIAKLAADGTLWLDLKASGSVVSFVDTRFEEAKLKAQAAATFGPIRRIEIQPVELRAIFTTIARSIRKEAA